MAVYYTSDTHYFHANVIRYSARPFEGVDHMNAEMVRRWCELVRPTDVVVHVGDVAFCGINKLQPLFDQLPGYKILVRGNHDRSWSDTKLLRLGFHEVHMQLYHADLNAVISHVPMDGLPTWVTNIHGHVHERWRKRGRHINVGVDQWDYTPVSAQQIEMALQQPDDSGYSVPVREHGHRD